MRRRFFVQEFSSGRAVMEADAAHHVGHVLRAQVGQEYELSDGAQVWLGRIDAVERDRVEFALVQPIAAYVPRLKIVLLLSVVKFDAFEWALEKATELGVTQVVPLAAQRSEKALLAAAAKRAERWKRIILEASQQCRRVRVPVLAELAKPAAAFGSANGLRVTLSELPGAPLLRDVLIGKTETTVTLAIGPEGGWADAEFAAARAAGFAEASLGRLILRAETAVVAALAGVNFALGD